MSTNARRPDKSDGTTDENDALTMAQIENALYQRPAVIDCPDCESDIRLTRDDLYAVGPIAQLTCENADCYFEDLLPHSWLQNNLSLPDDLEVDQ
jgi:hypothetical protein